MNMNDEVHHLVQHLEHLDIQEGRAYDGDVFRSCPSRIRHKLRQILDLIVHMFRCRSPRCLYPYCRKVKALFRHGSLCKRGAIGGCRLCKIMWCAYRVHARACKESKCNVPHCRESKERLRRLEQPQQKSDSPRGTAVEFAGSS
ncbi:hypothetical protein OROHE_025839 [Orobanche hederae]